LPFLVHIAPESNTWKKGGRGWYSNERVMTEVLLLG